MFEHETASNFHIKTGNMKTDSNINHSRLTFLRYVDPHISPNGQKQKKALYKCECGGEKIALVSNVKSGSCKSCGCMGRGKPKTHGFSDNDLYAVWRNMKARCYNKNNRGYDRYGARGIYVCEDWLNSPSSFIKWSILNGYKKGLEIDRIDNDGIYSPSNCRYVSAAANTRNRSTTKLNWDIVDEIRSRYLQGNIKQYELAKIYNLSQSAICQLINNKRWTV